jgi:hypothetical protein
VPYASHVTKTVLIADGPDGEMAVALEGTGDAEVTRGKNIANESRDTLAFTDVHLSADAVGPLGKGVSRGALYRRGALARATMMSGASACGVLGERAREGGAEGYAACGAADQRAATPEHSRCD